MGRPVQVVDQAQRHPVLSRLGQQAEQAGRDQEVIPVVRRPHAERGAECGCLRRGQPADAVQHRQQQLMERGEGQLSLGFHALSAEHPGTGGPVGRLGQECGLARPRLTDQGQRTAAPLTRLAQQAVEHREFRVPAAQHR